jgi:hypothetical protein
MANAHVFLKIDGVQGGSTDPAHVEWIELVSWSWGRKHDTSGGGSGMGPTGPDLLHFVISGTERAFAPLFHAGASGSLLGTAHLDVRSPEGDVAGQAHFTGVFVEHFSHLRNDEHMFSIRFATLTPGLGVPLVQPVKPGHAGLMNEALHARARPGGK